jgi:hypothetical protein
MGRAKPQRLRLYPGRYVLKIAANNSFRRVELQTKITVVKARPKPVPRAAPGDN